MFIYLRDSFLIIVVVVVVTGVDVVVVSLSLTNHFPKFVQDSVSNMICYYRYLGIHYHIKCKSAPFIISGSEIVHKLSNSLTYKIYVACIFYYR